MSVGPNVVVDDNKRVSFMWHAGGCIARSLLFRLTLKRLQKLGNTPNFLYIRTAGYGREKPREDFTHFCFIKSP